MTDYSNTIIYKIICKDETITECYVGHTTDFDTRYKSHLNRCNNLNDVKSNYKVYQFIREYGGWENWKMIEIEKCSCNDDIEARKKERYYIETLGATLNSNIPLRTDSEYYQDNREIILEKSKKYREENKEYYSIYNKNYKEERKEYFSNYDKIYRINNFDKIKEQTHQYRIDNLEKLKKKASQQIKCICGIMMTYSNVRRHEQSQKHIQFVEQNKKT